MSVFEIDEENITDRLDLVSRKFKKEPYASKGLNTYDFKKYDYPEFE